MKNRPFTQRLRFALRGVRAAWSRERSFRTQVVVAVLALAALAALRAPSIWWAIIVLTISVVLAVELMNSALEALIDHLHPAHHRAIGIAKDIAAAAVLATSLGAMVVGAVFLLAMFSR